MGTYSRTLLATIAMFVAGIMLTGCNSMQQVDTPLTAAEKVDRAEEARSKLWVALEKDYAAGTFTEAEWRALQAANLESSLLSAEIDIVLGIGEMPNPAVATEWKSVGQGLYDIADPILTKNSARLSTESTVAWAIYRARLRLLLQAVDAYLANPNAETYKRLAKYGLTFIGLL